MADKCLRGFLALALAAVLIAPAAAQNDADGAAGAKIERKKRAAQADGKAQKSAAQFRAEAQKRLMGQRMKALDKDGDGKVTLEEYLAVQKEAFARLDRDGDGVLLLEELDVRGGFEGRSAGADRMREMMARMDVNKDGAITPDEFRGRDEDFKRIDHNGDGKIDKEELATIGQRDGRGIDLKAALEGFFKARDANNDGALQSQEFPLKIEMFNDIDADNDGAVTPEEFGEYLKDNPRAQGMLRMSRRAAPAASGADMLDRLFETRDGDKDDRLSVAEMEGKDNFFAQYDANSDGYLTREELKEFKPSMPMMMGRDGRDGRQGLDRKEKRVK